MSTEVVNYSVWWQAHSNELPKWSGACKKVFLVQPSSERVFSLLENSFKTGLHGNFIDVTTIIHKLPHPFFWSIIIFLGAQLVHKCSIKE